MITAESILYPALEPFAVQQQAVGNGHAICFEQSGNPRGFPAMFLHGGPGSHARPLHRRFFDPSFYRIILADQRGCGRSTPRGCTKENTTRHLVEDIEALRERLGLERVMLLGGSWGACLALAYAKTHPQRVAAMVLRGVFLGTRAEVNWYLGGLGRLVPQAWQGLEQGEGGDLLARYHALVNHHDQAKARAAAQRWVAYEEAIMAADSGQPGTAGEQDTDGVLARARVQLHYLAHDCFLAPGALMSGLTRLAATPVLVVQGRRDLVCPPHAALKLAERLPGAELRLIEEGGHSVAEPAMAQALRRAVDDLRGRL